MISSSDERYKFEELDGHNFCAKKSSESDDLQGQSRSNEVEIEYLKFVGSQLLAVAGQKGMFYDFLFNFY